MATNPMPQSSEEDAQSSNTSYIRNRYEKLNTVSNDVMNHLAALINALENASDVAVCGAWITEILRTMKLRKQHDIVIGIAGATGSGKSSLVNALLGKNLAPTGNMGACTSTVVTYKLNIREGRDEQAEAEFISKEDWYKEVDVLLSDVQDSYGSINDPESPAHMALLKLTAVYPFITNQNVLDFTCEGLKSRTEVDQLLDQTRSFSADDPEDLRDLVEQYISSGLECDGKELKLWPLLREVRIYTQASVLEAGGQLVDLPGTADSNTARSAISRKYLQKCNALWIVAASHRAQSDHPAKTLLGDGMRRQLHRDGTLKHITFVCTKTDDLTIRAAKPEFRKYADFRQGIMMTEERKVDNNNNLQKANIEVSGLKRQIDKLKKSHQKAQDDLDAYTPASPHVIRAVQSDNERGKKRPATSTNDDAVPNKKIKTEVVDLTGAEYESSQGPASNDTNSHEPRHTVGTASMDDGHPSVPADRKYGLLVTRERKLRQGLKEVEYQKERAVENLDRISREKTEIVQHEWLQYVDFRNKRNDNRIREDFKAGVKEFHWQIYGRNNPNFDSRGLAQEHDLGDSLPVFSVSSHGYQKLIGLVEDENGGGHFPNIEATGIPNLRRHARQLGEREGIKSNEAFLDMARSLVMSIGLWSSGVEPGEDLKSKVKQPTKSHETVVGEFMMDLTNTIEAMCIDLKDEVTSNIVQVMPRASKDGINGTDQVAQRWRNTIHHATYWAIVKREGSYANIRST